MGAGLINPTHLIFLAVLALLLFGAKRLPEVGRSLGTGLREFKTSVSALDGTAAAILQSAEVDARTASVDGEAPGAEHQTHGG